MATTFIIGRSGCGKTLHCFNSIVASMRADPLGPPIHWILPRQATFLAERDLACASGLGGFSRARVVSFDRLIQLLLDECGGAAVPQITSLGRRMILGHLLRQHQDQLTFFRSSARQPGLAARLDSAFSEMERAGQSPADLQSILHDLDHTATPDDIRGTSLLAKLSDLQLLYSAYTTYLGQDRLDPHRRQAQVLQRISQSKLLQTSDIYVDGFADFSEGECQLLAALAQSCRHLTVALLLDPRSPTLADPHTLPHELSLFHRTEEAYRRLYFALQNRGLPITPPTLLTHISRFTSPSLAHLERHLFSPSPQPAKTAEDIQLVECPDRRAEADAAARAVRSLLQSGYRLREIGVLMRDLGKYHELIDAAFDEHEINYFVDRRRTAAHHPVLQFIRAAILIARNQWPHEAVMTLIKCGLSGLTPDEADLLENYVLLHRIKGSIWAAPDPWNYQRNLTLNSEDDPASPQAIELATIESLRRRIVDRLAPFIRLFDPAQSLTVRQIVVALFDLFERFDLRKTLAGWMQQAQAAGRLEQRGEHEQVWSELTDLLDQLVDLLGNETVSLDGFQEILESGLESFDLALTPPTVDQVLVGQIDRTRSSNLRAVIVLGLSEGQFPLSQHEDSVLSDADRRSLRQRNLRLDPDSQRQILDENLLGYIAFTRASQRLILIRACADEAGRRKEPSPFWRNLRAIFPTLKVLSLSRDHRSPADLISTPRQLITSLMTWVRDPSPAKDEPWPALYHWLATHPPCDDAVDRMRFRAWRALGYANNAALSPAISQKLFPSPLHAGVTQIESFANCPFKHFATYGLRLSPREEPEVSAIDLGNVYHQILERLVRRMIHAGQNWPDPDPAWTEEQIRIAAQDVGQSLRNELMISSPRNRYLLQRVEKTLAQVVATHRQAALRGSFAPAYAELKFGPNADLPALQIRTPSGGQLLLHGKIDRVDLVAGQTEFAVIDYKLRGNRLNLGRVYHGISLQLLTYLLVLQAGGQKLTGKPLTPLAAFYVQLLRKLEQKTPDEALDPEDPRFHLSVKPRGIFDQRAIPALDRTLESGTSDVVAARINKDGSLGKTQDALPSADFNRLLSYAHGKLAELADQILAGRIDVMPYQLKQVSPCPHCDFHSVCRFDPAVNNYCVLRPMSREDVLHLLAEGPTDVG